MTTFQNVIVGLQEVVLIAIDIILLTSINNIDEMIRNDATIDAVIDQVLTCAEIHSPIYLTAVGTDDLTVQTVGESDCERCFATCGRSENSQHFHWMRILVHAKVHKK